MAIDTNVKRAAAAGVPYLPLGVNVTPGTLATVEGRAAAAWSYGGNGFPAGGGGPEQEERIVLGDRSPAPASLGGTWG